MFIYGRVEDEEQAVLYSRGFNEAAAKFFEGGFGEVRSALAGGQDQIRPADTLKFVGMRCGGLHVYLVCDVRLADEDIEGVVRRARREHGEGGTSGLTGYIDYLLDDNRIEDTCDALATPAASQPLCTRAQRIGLLVVVCGMLGLVAAFLAANTGAT